MNVDRRTFLEVAASMVAAGTLPGCASVALTRLAPTAGALRLSLEDYPQLVRSGGYLKIQPEGSQTPIYLLAGEPGEFAALSPICTHLGCTVNIEGAYLVCPCHGSTYDRAGGVVRGPAERPLRQYPVEVTPGRELIIQLDGAT